MECCAVSIRQLSFLLHWRRMWVWLVAGKYVNNSCGQHNPNFTNHRSIIIITSSSSCSSSSVLATNYSFDRIMAAAFDRPAFSEWAMTERESALAGRHKQEAQLLQRNRATVSVLRSVLRSAPPCQISRLSGQKCGNTALKTKISNFGHNFASQGSLVCTMFTKFSDFVRVYRWILSI